MLIHAHSGIRYLVLAAALWTIGYAAFGLITRRQYDKGMRISSAVFTGIVDLNVLIGVGLLLTRPFYSQLAGHIATMVLAAVVAHVVPLALRRRPVAERTYAPHLVGTVVVLGLVVMGIMAIGRPVLGS